MTPLIIPQWPLPSGVAACSSTRNGGVSAAPWDSLNLGDRCGDLSGHVEENRRRLCKAAHMPNAPVWLEQVHGTRVLKLDGTVPADCKADASWTNRPGTICAVMTADCLPVLFCNADGTEVAAAHAGWRGLCAGVLESTVACFNDKPENIIAWMGPAIGPQAFEVGAEVRAAFMAQAPEAESAFNAKGDKFLGNLYLLARQRLANIGVRQVYGGERCTYTEQRTFFSWRRDGTTGRMASFIWLI